ncbi:MAG: LEA type 2 family protein [Trueperaceae bacterium]
MTAHRTPRAAAAALGAVAAVLVLLLAACVPRTVNEITDATPLVDVVAPRFTVEGGGTRIERFDPPGAGAGLEAALAVSVANPNEFGIVLERVEWTLRLAGRAVASGVLEPGLAVPGGAEVPFGWVADASLADARELWGPVVGAFAGRPLPFEVEGRLRFVSEVYAFTSGVRTLFAGELVARQTVRAPQLALFEAAHEATAVRPDAPVLRVALSLTNLGDVGYFVSGRDVRVALGVPRTTPGDATRAVSAKEALDLLEVGRVDLAPVPVPAGATVRTDLFVYVDPATLAPAALRRLESALAGVPTPFSVVGAWAYDVLGVDSFALESSPELLGLIGPDPLP